MAIDPRTGQPIVDPTHPPPAVGIVPPAAFPDESHKVETEGPQRSVVTTAPNPQAANALTDMAAAQKAELSAADKENDLKQDQLKAEAVAEKMRAERAQKAQEERVAAQAEHHAKISAKVAEADRARDAMVAAGKPRDFWEDNGGTLGKVLSSFLLTIGGAAAGATGQRNAALDVLNDAQAQHRQAAIDRFTKSKEFVELRDKDVAAAKEALADKMAEINSNEIAQGKVLDRQLGALTKRIGTPAAQAAYEKWRGEHGAEQSEKLAKEYGHYDRKETNTDAKTTQSDTLNVGRGPQNDNTLVYGQQGTPLARTADPKQATEANKSLTSYRQLDSILGELEKSYREHGRLVNPLGAESARRKSLQSQATIAYKEAANLGALSGPDMNLVADGIGGGWTGDQAVAKLQEARAGAKRSQAAYLDQRGLKGQDVVDQVNAAPKAATPTATKDAKAADAKPAAPKEPARTKGDAAKDLMRVDLKIKALPKDSPERARWQAVRSRIRAEME